MKEEIQLHKIIKIIELKDKTITQKGVVENGLQCELQEEGQRNPSDNKLQERKRKVEAKD